MYISLHSLFIVGIIGLIVSFIIMGVVDLVYPNDYRGCLYLPGSSTKYYIATFIIGCISHVISTFIL